MKKIVSSVLVAGLLSACGISSKPPEGDYSAHSTYSTQEVFRVKIISKKEVKVSSDRATGKIAGAVIGGIAGHSAGGGKSEKAVGAIVGALAGSAIGDAVEGKNNVYIAFEYVIEDERGDLQAVLVSNGDLEKGDKAFLILSDRPVLRKR